MELLPHLDIVEPDRIASMLADPDNFAWRAVDCETLDTWSADLGLTGYPVPSIYRPAGIATSGISSTLRHRFWGTVEGQCDHTGARYVGIVLYDVRGEESPMELRLAGDDIGRIEPTRHDNRRHLIVADRPVHFQGEMEVFRLTAPGRGLYRIEHFVLLHKRPEPSRFVPQIRNLQVAAEADVDGRWKATLHFVSSQLATCTVEGFAEGRPTLSARDDRPRALHSLCIEDLAAESTYTFNVTAQDRSGLEETESITCTTFESMQSTLATVVPVQIFNRAPIMLDSMPLTFGLPLPQGRLFADARCDVQVGSYSNSAQYRIHARWPDGSARWALVDTVLPPHLPAENPLPGEVRFGPGPGESTTGLLCLSSADNILVESARLRVELCPKCRDNWLRIERIDGEGGGELLLPAAKGRSLGFDVMLGNGHRLAQSPIRDLHVEEVGSHRTVLHFAMDHVDEEGIGHLRSNMRLHIFADQSFVKIVHRLEVISPALAPAAAAAATAGNVAAAANDSSALHGAIAGVQGEEAALLKLRRFSMQLPLDDVRSLALTDEHWDLNEKRWQLIQDDDRWHRVGMQGQLHAGEGRQAGQLRVTTAAGSVGIAIRRFWQTYPKGVQVAADGVQLDLFPELTAEPPSGDEDAWHRLDFWRRDDLYLLKAGMALSNEILLDFSEGEETLPGAFAWLEDPPVARPDLDALERSGALFPIAAKHGSALPDYETLVDQSIDSFEADREHHRAYGQINFGDWYGESGWSWGNNEYDPALCAYIEFLRGGSPRWASWGAESTRHLADVDTVNHSTDPGQIGGQAMHMPGHLGGYLPPLFRSKMGGTKFIPSHTWVEGPALHYLLTGDETARESMQKSGQWLLQDGWFDDYDFSNCREAGWHLIHLSMLARIGANPRPLNAISVIVERVLDRQEPGGGWVRMLQESHCGCGYPRCRGEAGFMVGVLLSGLQRVYQITGDDRVARAIVGGARWLICNTYDEKAGHFRYTSCPNRTLGGGFQQTQWVLEGLAGAYALSGDLEIGRYLRRGLSSIGRFPEGLDHLGLGKAIAQQMRYVPTLLWALQQRSLPEDDR